MSSSLWGRLAPWAGIAFVVLVLAGLALATDSPASDDSDDKIADYLADGGRHARNILGLYLVALASLSFFWFLARLRDILRRAEGETGALSNLGFISGAVFIALLLVGTISMVVVAASLEFGDAPAPDADVWRLSNDLGFGVVIIGGAFTFIPLVVTTSIVSLQTGAFPQWLAWFGFVVALALLFSFTFIAMIALPIWVLAMCVAMLLRPVPAT